MELSPDTAERMLAAVDATDAGWSGGVGDAELSAIPAGAPFTVPDLLFSKLEDDQLAEWQQRFGGG